MATSTTVVSATARPGRPDDRQSYGAGGFADAAGGRGRSSGRKARRPMPGSTGNATGRRSSRSARQVIEKAGRCAEHDGWATNWMAMGYGFAAWMLRADIADQQADRRLRRRLAAVTAPTASRRARAAHLSAWPPSSSPHATMSSLRPSSEQAYAARNEWSAREWWTELTRGAMETTVCRGSGDPSHRAKRPPMPLAGDTGAVGATITFREC